MITVIGNDNSVLFLLLFWVYAFYMKNTKHCVLINKNHSLLSFTIIIMLVGLKPEIWQPCLFTKLISFVINITHMQEKSNLQTWARYGEFFLVLSFLYLTYILEVSIFGKNWLKKLSFPLFWYLLSLIVLLIILVIFPHCYIQRR